MREWQVKRRERTRQLIELGGLVAKAGLVELADDEDNHRTVTLVGNDEADAGAGRIGWTSPLARALRGAAVGDVRTVQLPGGAKAWEVMAIHYPAAKNDLIV